MIFSVFKWKMFEDIQIFYFDIFEKARPVFLDLKLFFI